MSPTSIERLGHSADKPMPVFDEPRPMLGNGLPQKPNAIEALEIAVQTLLYMGQDNVALWCAGGLR